MDIKIIVSSHIQYIEKTEDILFSSLIDSGVNEKNILFFVGGRDINAGYSQVSEKKYLVPHNSMDFTALISVLELNIVADGFFLIHDTCKCGPNFYSNFLKLIKPNIEHMALTIDGPSMNMGLYSQSYIQDKKDEILSYKNTEYHEQGLQKYKNRLIKHEDIFLSPKKNYFCSKPRTTTKADNFYGTDSKRIIEYFQEIDFYKIKANWFLKKNYKLTI